MEQIKGESLKCLAKLFVPNNFVHLRDLMSYLQMCNRKLVYFHTLSIFSLLPRLF